MDISTINVNVSITGDILVYSKDGMLIHDLMSSDSNLILLKNIIEDYKDRRAYFENKYNKPPAKIGVNIIDVDEDGDTTTLASIKQSKFVKFLNLIIHDSTDVLAAEVNEILNKK